MTNAWIQRLLTLGGVLLAWGTGVAWWGEHRLLAYLCFIAPVFATAAPLASQFIALRVVNRDDPSPRAKLSEYVKAFWGELGAAVKVFHWWQPFRRAAIADGLGTASLASGQRGVVLVHGFFCNRAFWTHWMRRLHAQKRPFIALDLEPAYGSIDAYTASIGQAVRQMHNATGRSPVLVGHSMGGLAIRAWLASPGAQAPGKAAAHRVITLGSPHHGTWLAQFSHTTNGGQMQLQSRWINSLKSSETVPPSVEFVCFYSNCDNIVFPVSSARLEGADNRLILGRGHIDMVHDAAVMDVCWGLLQ